jgi:transcriptional regulator with XRE-family HTH domain
MDSKLYRVFGSRLRALREEKSVTQEELARRVELSRTSITNIEKGRQRIMLHQVVELAEALDADLGALIAPALQQDADEALRPDVARVIERLQQEGPDEA